MFISSINDSQRVGSLDIRSTCSLDLSRGAVPVTMTPVTTPAAVIMASALVGAQVADMGD